MFKICKYQLKQGLLSTRTYIALLIGITIEIVNIMPLLEFSKVLGEPLNIFDAFLYFNCNGFNAAIVFLGLIILVSDIPFTAHTENYILLRTTKKKWVLGKIMYLLVMCIFYYIVLFLVGWLFTSDNIYIGNFWSQPIYQLSKDQNFMFQTEYNVNFQYNYLLTSFTPVIATVLSATLSICYGFIMSLFIFLMNLLFPRILGYFYSMLLHILNYMLIFIFTTHNFVKYSILGNNILIYHNFEGNKIGKYALTISQSYLLNIVIVIILIFFIIKSTYKYDFKTVVGVKNEYS